tara:strand:+ start:409 stop:597 length:189 start_codon:yes stop_codon:yes gene_type:complete
MAKYKYRNHHSYEADGTTIKSTYQDIEDTELKIGIPISEDNRDYQDFLVWVEAGNTAGIATE